jgi:cyclic nucleotide gated channel alpha 3
VRAGYLEHGLLVRDTKLLAKHFMSTLTFRLYIVSMLPTDLLYIAVGIDATIVRVNRLFRFMRLAEFFERTETATNYPNAFRIINLIVYILILIHWNACIYFQVYFRQQSVKKLSDRAQVVLM